MDASNKKLLIGGGVLLAVIVAVVVIVLVFRKEGFNSNLDGAEITVSATANALSQLQNNAEIMNFVNNVHQNLNQNISVKIMPTPDTTIPAPYNAKIAMTSPNGPAVLYIAKTINDFWTDANHRVLRWAA